MIVKYIVQEAGGFQNLYLHKMNNHELRNKPDSIVIFEREELVDHMKYTTSKAILVTNHGGP
jgi:hypothetical protein